MEFISMMIGFAPLFSQRVWPQALTLVMGALLALGKRTVSQVLRVIGLAEEAQFQRYYRVLNRAVWSSRQASHILVNVFASEGVVAMGLDDTIYAMGSCEYNVTGAHEDEHVQADRDLLKAYVIQMRQALVYSFIPTQANPIAAASEEAGRQHIQAILVGIL